MTMRDVFFTIEPGVDGDGITAIEKEQLVLDVADAKSKADAVAPATSAPGPGAVIAEGIMGPVWKDAPVNADWFSHLRDAANVAGPGGRVEFSKGVQYVTNDNGIEYQEGQAFIGNGATLVFRGDFGFRNKTPGVQAKEIHIDDMTISGWNDMSVGVDFRTVVDSHISRVTLNGFVDYGVMFGGDNDIGGWSNSLSHSRVWNSPVSTEPDSAGVWLGGTTTGGVPNANNITLFSNRIQSFNGYAIYINKGDGNHIIANDMGYASTHPAVYLTGGWATRGNFFNTNRYEKAGGSLVIDGADLNMFIGEYFGTPDASFTGYNVTVLGGDNNLIRPALASNGSQDTWVSITGGNNNVAELGTTSRYRTAVETVYESRAVADLFNRFERSMNGAHRWGSGMSAPDVQIDRFEANMLRLAAGDSLYVENGAIRFHGFYLWVGSDGKLRIHNAAPPSGTSTSVGTVVGSQT